MKKLILSMVMVFATAGLVNAAVATKDNCNVKTEKCAKCKGKKGKKCTKKGKKVVKAKKAIATAAVNK